MARQRKGWLRRHGDGDGWRRPARLVPVWVALSGTFVTAVAVAAGALWLGLDLLDVHGVKREKQISSSVLFDLVKLSFAVVAGLGGLVALVVAYRKQRTEENAALRENTKLHSDRFTAAVAQLGDASPAVQLGGVHALAGLADDAPTRALRQTCIDVLCAYLRLPYDPDPGDAPEHLQARQRYRAIREVRHTIIRIIGNHLRPEATVSWDGHDFDFTDVAFDGGDLRNIHITSGTLTFTNAQFEGGTVDFTGARFRGGTVDFTGARFKGGTVDFESAGFLGGTVDFTNARLEGGTVAFGRVRLKDGMVDFGDALFRDGAVGFGSARFVGGAVNFRCVSLEDGTVDFRSASLEGGTVDFRDARFRDGKVDFGRVGFGDGRVDFRGVGFVGGRVDFTDAGFDGGTIDFTDAVGRRPEGLPDGMADHLS
ncbi:pentapeptide repeat-containing protein [Actinomadura macrotermitis]|uniref:Pentapeptide repeat-containing protein n=1 Tax=Actinomadura macrotermitis TaxID=2585200 RepID=A0A7K0BUW5_9ACTN|nr:pentapeptide repeat-containing protein [Actinomadura macrotermitis]MQY04995.1 hypothetical protein [Actinomadura macrotermitis]